MNDMKKWTASYSHIIVVRVFWAYFLFFILFHEQLHKVFTYLFFLVSGIYIGYNFAVFSYDYLNKITKN